MKLTIPQIDDAIEQVIAHCDLLQETYEPISLRSALYILGFEEEQADQVITDCAERGFQVCIDPMIVATRYDPDNPRAVNGMATSRPSADACYWMPDQLKSRLECLSSRRK